MYSIFCQTYANVGILFQTGKHLRLYCLYLSFSPYFFIFLYNVEGSMCSISAVRFGCPCIFSKALMMDCFSCVSFSGKRKIFSFSSSILMFKQAVSIIGCLDSRTARLILFCNSRTFPGQPYESSCCSASRLNPSVCRLSSLENFSLKCSASGSMSSGHSCRAGRTISNSPRRW